MTARLRCAYASGLSVLIDGLAMQLPRASWFSASACLVAMSLAGCASEPQVVAPESSPPPPPLYSQITPPASTSVPPPGARTGAAASTPVGTASSLPLCAPGKPARTVDCSNDALGPRMSLDQLQSCATQAVTLRRESTRLMQINSTLAAQRNVINQRTAAVQAGSRVPYEMAQQFEQERLGFNAQADQFRREVLAIGQLRSTYDLSCSRRPYRRSDLASLSPELQTAMRMGLGDVAVPMLGANDAPFPAPNAQPFPSSSPSPGPQLQRISW